MYKVFIADDEEWSLVTLKKIVNWDEYGFVIAGEATDGETALSRIENIHPDLIVSDIRMPNNDGLELVEKIRERGENTKVILVSGYTDFEYAQKAIQFGCMGYVVKPVEEEKLIYYLDKARKELDEIYHIEENSELDDKVGYKSDKLLVKNMLQYIKINYAKPVSLKMLSENFKLSESYISNLIKKVTGRGFGEHLLEIRIKEAQKLLSQTNYSIEKIAEMVGYQDYFYFTKVYKKATGITPTAYRKGF